MNLKEGLTKIIKEYPTIREYVNLKQKEEKGLIDSEMEKQKEQYSKFMNGFRESIQKLVLNNTNINYNIKSSTFAQAADIVPYITINNPNTHSINENFYPVYLFKPNGTGVYLCLCLGVNQFKKSKSTSFNKKELNDIKTLAKDFREHVKKEAYTDSNNNQDFSKFEEVCDLESKNELAKAYNSGIIYCKYYKFNEKENICLPSNKELEYDLMEFIELYQYFTKYIDYFNKLIVDYKQSKSEKYRISTFYNSFYDYLNQKKYYFDGKTIENYLLSLKVKPFIILTGNSGTGKTKIAQLFAQYLQKKLAYENNYELVAVGANWTDNRDIFGFKNVVTGDYHRTPVCDLIKEAKNHENKPYFLILDEMNLSHVERYFADFLSALESDEKIKKPGTNEKFKIPNNLFVIGTVNVDETTYMFSPKVLDRANVLEFKTVPVDKYMDMNFEYKINSHTNINYLENPLCHNSYLTLEDEERLDINDLKEKYPDEYWDILKTHLTELHIILSKSNFDFGFRVTNEILSFVLEAYNYEENDSFDWKRYFDAQILQKILPKLHGSRSVLENTLKELQEYCEKNEFENSASKLKEMNDDLETLRYVSFIN